AGGQRLAVRNYQSGFLFRRSGDGRLTRARGHPACSVAKLDAQGEGVGWLNQQALGRRRESVGGYTGMASVAQCAPGRLRTIIGEAKSNHCVVPSLAERRILVLAPQPFYDDPGTPIALRQVLEALAELGYRVDLLTLPVGTDMPRPGLSIFRAANPLRIRSVP